MPAVPSCLLEPLWDQFTALLPAREDYAENHPLACHRRRVPDRVVFDHIVLAPAHGCGSASPLPDVPIGPSGGVSDSGLNWEYPRRCTLSRSRRTTG